MDDNTRFWNKVDKSGNCWIWLAARTNRGYGNFYLAGGWIAAHRFAYESLVGPIPKDLFIDHLCRNRECVNPDHMEPVTNRVNIQRGEKATKDNCIKGHDLRNPENTYIRPNGTRCCRACSRIRNNKRESGWVRQRKAKGVG